MKVFFFFFLDEKQNIQKEKTSRQRNYKGIQK